MKWLINSAFITLGYSKFFPCTPAGRGFAVIYCLLGLPVVFVVLNDAGHLAEIFLQKLWNFSHRKVEFVTMHLGKLFGRTKVSRYRSNTSQPIPALFGLVLSFAWIFLVALYFDLTEEELDYGDCLFFTFITLTSIGLGEFAPNRYYYIQFFLFFFGLVLFSTAVKIFQANVAAMIQQITTAVDEDFKNRMLAGDNNPGGDKKLGGMIKAAGPFLRRLMPKDRQKEIEAKFLALENLKVASAQVNYELVDKTVDASIQMVDRMVDASLGNQDEEASAVVEQNSAETNSAVASVDATEQTSASKFRPYMLKTKDWHSASS